jgi:NAD(P)-dependent dehydrogenase (short-subunit alcohol dehydrogenase family)
VGPEAAFDRSFAINVKGPYFLIQALLPIFANPASIILNASVNAHIGMPNTSVYGATKGALLSLARTLSGKLISRGIRVNAVSSGPISTPLYSKLGCPKPIAGRWLRPFKPNPCWTLRKAQRDRPCDCLSRLRRIRIHSWQRTFDRWRHA